MVIELDKTFATRYRALMLTAYASAPDAFTSTAAEREKKPLAWWEARLGEDPSAAITFGAIQRDELVGAVTLEFSERQRTQHKAHLIGMYVSPSVRGQGLGRELVQACVATALSRGFVKTITLTVTQGNEVAEALYREAGFERFGVEPMAVLGDQGFLAKVHMVKTL